MNSTERLTRFRMATKDLVFHDFTLPSSRRTEAHLWDAHGKVNSIFRRKIARFRSEGGKKKVVERRKLEMQYKSFIKSSQSFYRDMIQSLASHFSGVEEVLEVARKIKSDAVSIDNPVIADATQKELVLRCCHTYLMHLGDLSRYREAELQLTNRNWGPAKGYYSLALALLPASGWPYNQLAVIARVDKDILNATYYLYRALMQREPYSSSQQNLDIDFRKTRERWDDPENRNMKDGMFTQFRPRFVLFHAFCYGGTDADLDGHRDLETELVHEIAVNLLPNEDMGLLNKICLMNIAAEAAALDNWKAKKNTKDQGSPNTFHRLQSFNIKVMTQLLQTLVIEVRRVQKLRTSSELEKSETMTPIIHCTIPILRQYSSWLLAEVPLLVLADATAQDSAASAFQRALGDTIKNLWPVYMDALAGLASNYELKGGRKLRYLLVEDEDTLDFKPFLTDEILKSRYLDEAGNMKPRSSSANVQREEPLEEMRHRIRGIVKDGLVIAQSKDPKRMVPIRLMHGRFVLTQLESSSGSPELSGQINVSQPLSGLHEVAQLLPGNQSRDTSPFPLDTKTGIGEHGSVEGSRSSQSIWSRPQSSHVGVLSIGKATFTAADLVKQIQRSAESPSLTAQTPNIALGSSSFPSGLRDSVKRPASSHASQPSKISETPRFDTSSLLHSPQRLRPQQEFPAPSSPHRSTPQQQAWLRSHYDTPTDLHSFVSAQPQSPSWLGPTTPLEPGHEEVKKPLPQRNLFGAIGEPPKWTPTSAQPD